MKTPVLVQPTRLPLLAMVLCLLLLLFCLYLDSHAQPMQDYSNRMLVRVRHIYQNTHLFQISMYLQPTLLLLALVPWVVLLLCFPRDQLRMMAGLSYCCLAWGGTSLWQMARMDHRPFWHSPLQALSCTQSFASPCPDLVLPLLGCLVFSHDQCSYSTQLILFFFFISIHSMFSLSQYLLGLQSLDQLLFSFVLSLLLFAIYLTLFKSLLYSFFRYCNKNIHNSELSQPQLVSFRLNTFLVLCLISGLCIFVSCLVDNQLSLGMDISLVETISQKWYSYTQGLMASSFYRMSWLLTPLSIAMAILLRSSLFGDIIQVAPLFRACLANQVIKALLLGVVSVAMFWLCGCIYIPPDCPWQVYLLHHVPYVLLMPILYLTFLPALFLRMGLVRKVDWKHLEEQHS